jgi:hypothetical protein
LPPPSAGRSRSRTATRHPVSARAASGVLTSPAKRAIRARGVTHARRASAPTGLAWHEHDADTSPVTDEPD